MKITDMFGQEHDAKFISQEDEPYLKYEYKVITRRYNPKYGDNRMCVCGHPYHRHFDLYESDEARSCKYCGCNNFIEQSREDKT